MVAGQIYLTQTIRVDGAHPKVFLIVNPHALLMQWSGQANYIQPDLQKDIFYQTHIVKSQSCRHICLQIKIKSLVYNRFS